MRSVRVKDDYNIGMISLCHNMLMARASCGFMNILFGLSHINYHPSVMNMSQQSTVFILDCNNTNCWGLEALSQLRTRSSRMLSSVMNTNSFCRFGIRKHFRVWRVFFYALSHNNWHPSVMIVSQQSTVLVFRLYNPVTHRRSRHALPLMGLLW